MRELTNNPYDLKHGGFLYLKPAAKGRMRAVGRVVRPRGI